MRGRGRYLVVAALVGLVGAATLRIRDRSVPPPRGVVLVLIDTLRADHLRLYGYARPTSPFLDALAARSVVFEHAVSAASTTFPAVNSLFTSRHPDVFFDTTASNLGIPRDITTLAEVFQAHGFRTGAVSASPVVRRSPSRFNPEGGFGRGFEVFDESCLGRPDRVPPFTAFCVADAALRIAGRFGQAPFFLYVHYLDPHDPYQPPPPWNRFAAAYRGKRFIAAGLTPPISGWLYEGKEDPHVTEEEIQHLRDLYDGEILGVDASLKHLVTGLAAKGRARDTLFVVLADHGESFMEHRHIQHGRSLYEPELHVPLIFHWEDRWTEGGRRHDLACTVDVMPTILHLAGLPPPPGLVGAALFDRDATGGGAAIACYSEGRADWRARRGNLVSVREGSDKVIYDRTLDRYEAFDLRTDPGELQSIAPVGESEGRPDFERLRAALERRAARAERGASAPETPVPLDPDLMRTLRALGYVQ